MAAGAALDVNGRRLVQLLHHTNTGRFLILPLEIGKRDTGGLPTTPRAIPATIGAGKRNTFNQ
jgi:hypothetical protein